MKNICNICSSENFQSTHHQPFPLETTAKTRHALNFEVAVCMSCGFIFQSSAYADPHYDDILKAHYENYVADNSPFPNRVHFREQGITFMETHIKMSDIDSALEIGSNRGDFLYLLKEKNPHLKIMGLESGQMDYHVPTINRFFTKDSLEKPFPLIISRFVLEHIKDPTRFLRDVHATLNPSGLLYIEVPNVAYYLENLICEFHPEHVNYFTAISLTNLLSKCGFTLQSLSVASETLYAIASKGDKRNHAPIVDKKALSLIRSYFAAITAQCQAMKDLVKKRKKIVFYGGGNMFEILYQVINANFHSSGMNFHEEISFCMDDEPSKAGRTTRRFDIPIRSSEYAGKKEDIVIVIAVGNKAAADGIYERLVAQGYPHAINPWRASR